MEWLDFLSTLILFVFFWVGVTLFVFALIGINKVYSDYKDSKWQKQYGDKLKEDTKRNEWENIERLRDKTFLLEETIKANGLENAIDKIDIIVSELNYCAGTVITGKMKPSGMFSLFHLW